MPEGIVERQMGWRTWAPRSYPARPAVAETAGVNMENPGLIEQEF
jgi:hypothetical protein